MTCETREPMRQRQFHMEEEPDLVRFHLPGARLTFQRAGHRWAHGLAVGEGPASLLSGVAFSLEESNASQSPERVVSPTYQELHAVARADRLQALLTGQALQHHFSAAVTARPDLFGAVIEVDVADRCRSPVAALSATYVVALGPGEVIDAGTERVVWGGDALGQGRLELTAEPPARLVIEEAGTRRMRVQVVAAIDSAQHTHRFLYRWRWLADEPLSGGPQGSARAAGERLAFRRGAE